MLKIEIRRHQHVDNDGNNVLIDCTNNIATYIPGTITDYNWIDITEDCEGLDSIEFSEKQPDEQNKQREKGATSQIVIGFDAYGIVIDWLMATPCSFLNYFDARITDTDLNYEYKLYEIKPDNIEDCDDDVCKLTLPLRETDQLKSIADKLSIHDNWQGWFGGNAKDFPCIQVFTHLNAMVKSFTLGAWAVAKSIAIFSLVGLFIDIAQIHKKAYGFGHFLPAPYIRDILQNVMQKVGYTINTPFDIGRFAENDVFVYSNGYYHTNFSDDNPVSPSQKFLFENRLIWQFSDFLEAICELYCCIWTISGNTLYIIPKKDNDSSSPIFEILEEDVISNCKAFSFEKGKAGANYEYSKDGTDAGSGQTINEYNDVVDFDGVTNNAMLDGLFDKKFRFSSSSFWGDSFGEDITEDIENFAVIVAVLIGVTLSCVALSFISGTAGANVAAGGFAISAAIVVAATAAITGVAIASINDLQTDDKYGYGGYYKGSLKVVGTGSIFTPRIIRLDPGSDMRNAKPVIINSDTIQQNPYYNTSGTPWRNQWNGYGDFGEAFNYPLFFDSNYVGNMYDTLHEKVDNSMFLKQSNESRKITVPLCSKYLSKTGVNNDDNSIIGKIILYKNTRYKVIDFQIKYTDLSITFNLKKQNEII